MTVDLHPAFAAAADAAQRMHDRVLESMTRAEREEVVAEGADGTPTMRIDLLVEEAIVEAVSGLGVNVLSEEIGFVDNASALTLVVDPLDGSANAAADVPLACFSAALAVDGEFTEASTRWLATGRTWSVRAGQPTGMRTTGRTSTSGAAISMLRPHPHTRDAWLGVWARAGRVRILSCSTLEMALVAQGSTDAFLDAGSDTHRLVDLVAGKLLVEAAGGVVRDVHGRAIELDLDLTRRWSGIAAATDALAEELAGIVAAEVGVPG